MPQHVARSSEHGGAGAYWLGVYYPRDYTVAVIDDLAEAKACVADVVDAGIAAADIELITGVEALATHRRQRQQRGWLERVLGAVPTDEHSVQDEYLANASEGAYFVAFRARTDDQEKRGRRALAAHHARLVRHYGRWTWEQA